MAWAPTDSLDRRDDLIARLVWRNRIVSVLRLAVPLFGVLLFLALVGQIWLANLARQFVVAGISISRGHLVVEPPHFAGTTPDGARYVVSAREARTRIDSADEIELTDATLDYSRPGKPAIFAAADTAFLDSAKQIVDVPALLTISGEDGLEATANNVHADLNAQLTHAAGAVAIKLADGTTIDAADMVFDGNTQTWTFLQATVVMSALPGAED
jgi:hypothetical protein